MGSVTHDLVSHGLVCQGVCILAIQEGQETSPVIFEVVLDVLIVFLKRIEESRFCHFILYFALNSNCQI